MLTYHVVSQGNIVDAIRYACNELGLSCGGSLSESECVCTNVVLQVVSGDFEKHRILCCSPDKQSERGINVTFNTKEGFVVAVNAEHEKVDWSTDENRIRMRNAMRQLHRHALRIYRLRTRPVGKRTIAAAQHRLARQAA